METKENLSYVDLPNCDELEVVGDCPEQFEKPLTGNKNQPQLPFPRSVRFTPEMDARIVEYMKKNPTLRFNQLCTLAIEHFVRGNHEWKLLPIEVSAKELPEPTTNKTGNC